MQAKDDCLCSLVIICVTLMFYKGYLVIDGGQSSSVILFCVLNHTYKVNCVLLSI